MPGRVDYTLIEEILGGDPLLLPEEAAAQLGIDEGDLTTRARAGLIASVQVVPDSIRGKGVRRYRQSVITALAAAPLPPAVSTG